MNIYLRRGTQFCPLQIIGSKDSEECGSSRFKKSLPPLGIQRPGNSLYLGLPGVRSRTFWRQHRSRWGATSGGTCWKSSLWDARENCSQEDVSEALHQKTVQGIYRGSCWPLATAGHSARHEPGAGKAARTSEAGSWGPVCPAGACQ